MIDNISVVCCFYNTNPKYLHECFFSIYNAICFFNSYYNVPIKIYVCDDGTFRPAEIIEIELGVSCTDYNEGSISRKSKITDYICKSSQWTQFVDSISYGGQIYHTVRIRDQIWFADNLNYADSLSILDLRGNSWCYDDDVENCKKYGRLYNWTAATTVCPEGWHLPSKDEWEILFSAVGGRASAGMMLRSVTGDWNGNKGLDAFGFSALPAGGRGSEGGYGNGDLDAFFWSSSENDGGGAYYVWLYGSNDVRLYDHSKLDGNSVRSLQN